MSGDGLVCVDGLSAVVQPTFVVYYLFIIFLLESWAFVSLEFYACATYPICVPCLEYLDCAYKIPLLTFLPCGASRSGSLSMCHMARSDGGASFAPLPF